MLSGNTGADNIQVISYVNVPVYVVPVKNILIGPLTHVSSLYCR